MMKLTRVCTYTGLCAWLIVLTGFYATSTNALANADLARKQGCLDCHNVDKRVVGPAYKDVAAKYKNDAGAEARLVEKVKKGGSGNWGKVPMPPHTHISDADLGVLVKWVLSQQGSVTAAKKAP
jgi:cytochrome c